MGCHDIPPVLWCNRFLFYGFNMRHSIGMRIFLLSFHLIRTARGLYEPTAFCIAFGKSAIKKGLLQQPFFLLFLFIFRFRRQQILAGQIDPAFIINFDDLYQNIIPDVHHIFNLFNPLTRQF